MEKSLRVEIIRKLYRQIYLSHEYNFSMIQCYFKCKYLFNHN